MSCHMCGVDKRRFCYECMTVYCKHCKCECKDEKIFKTKSQLAEHLGKAEDDVNIEIVWTLLRMGLIKDKNLIELVRGKDDK